MARKQCPQLAMADLGPASPHMLPGAFQAVPLRELEAGIKQTSRFYCSNHLSSEKEIK